MEKKMICGPYLKNFKPDWKSAMCRPRPCFKKVKTPKQWIFFRRSALNFLAGRQPACKNLP